MKSWHLWYSFRMPPGGSWPHIPPTPGFLNGPRYPRTPEAGKDSQQFFAMFPRHWQSGVPECGPRQSAAGRASLALRSYRLPVAALRLLRDVLHSGEV